MFSEKDFFGDPLWPTDFGSQKIKSSNLKESSQKDHKKSNFITQKDENRDSKTELNRLHDELYDFEKTFFLSQHRMQYSNLKHSQITYLDDFNKANLFDHSDSRNQRIVDQLLSKEDPDLDSQSNIIKVQQKEDFSELNSPNDSESSNISQDSDYSKQSEDQISQIRNRKKPYNLLNRKPNLKCYKTSKIQIYQKDESQMIDQLLNDDALMDENEKKLKMQKIEKEILKKLESSQKIECQRLDIGNQIKTKLKKKNKLSKYKILTQSQKQYLVYLSTLSTTCQVARRFNISVNNICRWKKGCARKVGAGRKISNQQLQLKVIEYVKKLVRNGENVTRKKIQTRAKQLSVNKNFKASKGWFQRFYTRNIEIFKHPSDEEGSQIPS